MRILIAEDERSLNEIIVKKLTSDGYSVDACFAGEEAISVLSYTDYDAVILDIMMPKADGFAVLRSLREAGKTTPVLFLTAKDAVSDRVKGLDSGANDYLVKPFDLEELEARIFALMKRAPQRTSLVFGDLTLDLSQKKVFKAGSELKFSLKELQILELLMRNHGIAVSRLEIIEEIR